MRYFLKVKMIDGPAKQVDASKVHTSNDWHGIYIPSNDSEDSWVAVKDEEGQFRQYRTYAFKDRTTDNRYKRVDIRQHRGKRYVPLFHKLKAIILLRDPRAMQKGYNVDHIDQNSLNNRIGNLQILSEKEHQKKTFAYYNKK